MDWDSEEESRNRGYLIMKEAEDMMRKREDEWYLDSGSEVEWSPATISDDDEDDIEEWSPDTISDDDEDINTVPEDEVNNLQSILFEDNPNEVVVDGTRGYCQLCRSEVLRTTEAIAEHERGDRHRAFKVKQKKLQAKFCQDQLARMLTVSSYPPWVSRFKARLFDLMMEPSPSSKETVEEELRKMDIVERDLVVLKCILQQMMWKEGHDKRVSKADVARGGLILSLIREFSPQ